MHGHMAIGTTVFPTAIGQASTWNPELIEKMAETIAKETRLQGGHIGYGPILDVAREPRWSRVEETFGEDTYLIGQIGKAMVKGFQGEDLNSGVNVASTLKHFAAYGITEGGQNGGITTLGEKDLFNYYLPPFKMALDAGAWSVMTSYNSLDGIPCTSNKFLLTDVLRDQWGFDGFVISDLGSIEGIHYTHFAANTPADAAALALNAGVDADLGGKGFGKELHAAIKKDLVTEEQINIAVKNVLRLKFEMGLFENPYVDSKTAEKEVRTSENISLARKVANESIILLKNEKSILPLSKDLKEIAVIGPNADVPYNQLGDYTAPQEEGNVVTVLQGIRNKVGETANIKYVKGCAIRDTTNLDIEKAVQAAQNADVAVVVLGGSSARDFKTSYQSTGAASVEIKKDEAISDMESGEGYDRKTLDLMGKQLQLVKEIHKTGTPVVVVLIKGRPLIINWISENVSAILDAWYPGQEGGNAIADVLFGDYNPAGRLPVSIPKSVGQLPIYYSHKPPSKHNYVEGDANPLYPFGFGLSYSSFEYKNLNIEVLEDSKGLNVQISFTIKNTSELDGEEVAQLYLRDKFSSVVLPLKQLKRFNRLPIKAGDEQKITFNLTEKDLMLYNQNRDWVTESGSFDIMIGSSSYDIQLTGEFEIMNSYSNLLN
jgi:beta-glucosidase